MKPNIIASLLIWPATAALLLTLYLGGALTDFEAMSYDWRMQTFNQGKAAPQQVAIIMIDEESLAYMEAEVGGWPWPRSVHGDLIEMLASVEALSGNPPRALLFDIIFPQRDLRDLGSTTTSSHDLRLADESAANDFVVHALHFGDETGETRSNPHILARRLDTTDTTTLSALALSHDGQAMIAPYAPLDAATPHIGVVSTGNDGDGTYRRTRLLHRQGEALFPSLSLAALLTATDATIGPGADGTLMVNDQAIPVMADGSYLINYYDKFATYRYSSLISAHKRLRAGDIDEELEQLMTELQGKILFVGTNSLGLYDMKPTPLNKNDPGVFIHASVVGNILSGDFLRQPGRWLTITLILGLALLCSALTLWHSRPLLRLLASPLLMALCTGLALWLFSRNIVVDMIAPLLSSGVAWGGSFLYLTFTEGRDKRRIRRMLSQYVSPAILAEVEKKHEEFLKAEIGTRDNLTILFSDIRNFTGISESMEAERVVEMLNIYISRMNEAIFMYEGTIDKFIGDAIMAFWGAPIRTGDHAHKAVLAAMRMIRFLPEVNEELQQHGYQPLAIGIGLNSGEVVHGNIGSEKKINYTVIGDNVNLASRLEGLTKQYDTPIIISEFTRTEIFQTIPCRLLDLVRVKGKQHPVRLYAPVICDSEQEKQQAFELCQAHEEAFERYLRRDWQGALDRYARLPVDPARNMMMERCQRYLQEMPEEQWDGVFTMKTK